MDAECLQAIPKWHQAFSVYLVENSVIQLGSLVGLGQNTWNIAVDRCSGTKTPGRKSP